MIKLNDILNSKFNKKTEEASAKDLELLSGAFVPAVPKKSVTIKVERILTAPDGSKTTYNVDMEHEFTSVAEMREVLETLGYGKKSLVSRIKTIFKPYKGDRLLY